MGYLAGLTKGRVERPRRRGKSPSTWVGGATALGWDLA